MSTVWLVIAIHAGLFAAGFGLAGVLQFQEFEERKGIRFAAGLDPTGIAMVIVAIGLVFENWEQVATGRRLIYAAFVSLSVMAVALFFR